MRLVIRRPAETAQSRFAYNSHSAPPLPIFGCFYAADQTVSFLRGLFCLERGAPIASRISASVLKGRVGRVYVTSQHECRRALRLNFVLNYPRFRSRFSLKSSTQRRISEIPGQISAGNFSLDRCPHPVRIHELKIVSRGQVEHDR